MLKSRAFSLLVAISLFCPALTLGAVASGFDFEGAAKYFFCVSEVRGAEWFVGESFGPLKNMQEVSKKAVKLIGHKAKYEYWNDGAGQFYLVFPETEDSTKTYSLCIALQDVKKNDSQAFQFKNITAGNRPPNGQKIAEGVVEIPAHPEAFLKEFKKVEAPKEQIAKGLRDFLVSEKIEGEQTFIVAPYTELDDGMDIYWQNQNKMATLSNSPDERFDFAHEPWVKFESLEPPKNFVPGLRSIFFYLFYVKARIANCVMGGTVFQVKAGNQ